MSLTLAPRLVLATRNEHKLVEFGRILGTAGLNVELVPAAAFASVPDVAETGATFEENALLKAVELAAATGLPAVADDSGLSVAALNGMPGVLSARWCGRHGDDLANLELVLAQLKDVPEARRGASFVCAAALALPSRETHVVIGELVGSIVRAPRGKNGFGYDPIFVPAGSTLTTAELDPAVKDSISHRGKALRALIPFVERSVIAGY